MPNVIPQSVEFLVDVRDVASEGIELITNALTGKVSAIATEDKLQGKIELIGASNPVRLSSRITYAIEEIVSETWL